MKLRPVYRITTFVPCEHLERLLEGINRTGLLRYGNYDSVFWWSAPGVEQFRPLQGAHPTAGQVGDISRLDSIQVIFSIPRDAQLLEAVLQNGVIPHHPWETPVICIDESMSPDE